jgi:hypothetical protein
MSALVEASDQRGYMFAIGDDVRQHYCPKCLYLGEDAIQHVPGPGIHVHVPRSPLLPLASMPSDRVTQDFQNRLLSYRVLNRERIFSSKFGVNGFSPEFRAVAQALAAPILDDAEVQTELIELLKEQDEQARVDGATGLNAIILSAVLFYCHQSEAGQVFVHEIAGQPHTSRCWRIANNQE